jgi:hypothetical protein
MGNFPSVPLVLGENQKPQVEKRNLGHPASICLARFKSLEPGKVMGLETGRRRAARRLSGSVNQALASGNRQHLGVHNQPLWGGAIEIKRVTGNQR